MHIDMLCAFFRICASMGTDLGLLNLKSSCRWALSTQSTQRARALSELMPLVVHRQHHTVRSTMSISLST